MILWIHGGAAGDYLDLPFPGKIGEHHGHGDLEAAGFDRRDQLRAALLQDLGGIGDQARRDIHLASGFLANPADGFASQICDGVQPLRCP